MIWRKMAAQGMSARHPNPRRHSWKNAARTRRIAVIVVGVGLAVGLPVDAGATPTQPAPSSGDPAPEPTPLSTTTIAPSSGTPSSGEPDEPTPSPSSEPPASPDEAPSGVAGDDSIENPVPSWPGVDAPDPTGVIRTAAEATGLLSPALASFGAEADLDADVERIRSTTVRMATTAQVAHREIESLDSWVGKTERARSARQAADVAAVDDKYLAYRSSVEARLNHELAELRELERIVIPLARPPAGPVQVEVLADFRRLRDELAAAEAQLISARSWMRNQHRAAILAVVQRSEEEADEIAHVTETRRQAIQAGAAQKRADVQQDLLNQQTSLVEARLGAAVPGTDFDLVLLDAFYRAAAAELECGIRWSVIAAISRIESWHGTYGGGEVDVSGKTTRRIVGPPLNGRGPVALIRDSENGSLDGDATYDRAVGPMQFIPTSWNIYGADGDGDGVSDPNDYHDAARAAAAHLCRSAGGRIETEEDMARAVKGYNRSEEYRANVRLWTSIYDHAMVIDSAMMQ